MMSKLLLHCLSTVYLLTALVLAGDSVLVAQTQEKASSVLKRKAESSQTATDASQPATTDEPTKPEYIRIRTNDRRLADALQTSVVTMSDSDQFPGVTVDLVGAIHLGEPGYYEELNSLFRNYDALLFEAVMPEKAVQMGLRPGGDEDDSEDVATTAADELALAADEKAWTDAKVGMTAISVLQLGMKDALGLEFQLSGINYQARNFVHADMTAEEFEQSMKKRGESFAQMFAQEMSKSLTQSQEQNPLAMNLDLMLSALAPDRMYRIRRIAAVQLAKAGEGEAFAGADGTSTIITERNIKALDTLQREMRNGRKHVGVFYGAGHLADMEERMREELGFNRTSEVWITAWELRAGQTAPPAEAK